jgi:hypothetical protein
VSNGLGIVSTVPGHDSIAAAARVLYDGRASALVQMLHKIETAEILLIAQEQGTDRAASGKTAGNHEEQSRPGPVRHCLTGVPVRTPAL